MGGGPTVPVRERDRREETAPTHSTQREWITVGWPLAQSLGLALNVEVRFACSSLSVQIPIKLQSPKVKQRFPLDSDTTGPSY
jgi:hypothetical protein